MERERQRARGTVENREKREKREKRDREKVHARSNGTTSRMMWKPEQR